MSPRSDPRYAIAFTHTTVSKLPPALYDAVARVWEEEIGGSFAHIDHTRTNALILHEAPDRALPRALDWQAAAVLLHLKVKRGVIDFSRVTLPQFRQRGYAVALLLHLRALYPRHTLVCENINPKLTSSLLRMGFTGRQDSCCLHWKP